MRKSLMLCAVPVLAAGIAMAQNNPPATSTDADGQHTATAIDNTQRPMQNHNYGWLGLLGLAGLMGLRRREVVSDRSVPMERNRQNSGDVRRVA